MLFLLFFLWFALSQQGRWLYPDLLILALYWGYFLGEGDGISHLKRRNLTGLLILSLFFVTINGGKIVLSQASNLGCFGESCLKFQPQLYEEYHRECPPADIRVPNGSHLGYFNCRVLTPREDFPWVK
jgi:hypothetical protein